MEATERRNDIRSAMQSLLTSAKRHDSAQVKPQPAVPILPQLDILERLPLPAGYAGPDARIYNDLQAELLEHGIRAETTEIAHAILEAAATRPRLCRGLLAAY